MQRRRLLMRGGRGRADLRAAERGAALGRSKRHGRLAVAGRVRGLTTQDEIRRGGKIVRLTGLDRVWWPDTGIRKADVVDYYRRIAPFLLPHLRDRPFTMKRHYRGPRSPFEWVKDAPPELPGWVAVSPQPAKSRGGALVRYPLVNDDLALLWMVEFGCVDLHVWTSRADRPGRPDQVLFDLDPAGVGVGEVAAAALLLRDALDALGLRSFPMTTGGEGMHVRVPISRRYDYPAIREFAEIVASALARAEPRLVTTARSRSERRGVFVDAKMNGHGQQVVSVYSVRPSAGAPVAAPLSWDEIDESLDPAAFTMTAVLDRAERRGDLYRPLVGGRQSLDRALGQVA
jgi:bifunctional non-homologous end joining protein LigD